VSRVLSRKSVSIFALAWVICLAHPVAGQTRQLIREYTGCSECEITLTSMIELGSEEAGAQLTTSTRVVLQGTATRISRHQR
jgi:hypothetical protein